MRETHPHYYEILGDDRYKDICGGGGGVLPLAESLEDTQVRVVRYYDDVIFRDLWACGNSKEEEEEAEGTKVLLVCSHANALRSLIMKLDDISPEDIKSVNVPTGKGILYEIGEDGGVVCQDEIKKGKFRGKFIE